MPDTKELEALLEKVEAARGADEMEINGRLAVLSGVVVMRGDDTHGYAFFHADEPFPRGAFLSGCKDGRTYAFRTLGACLSVANYTASVDAALALVDRMLPGWTWELDNSSAPPQYNAALSSNDGRFLIKADTEHYGQGPTLSLAILAALLKALIAQEAE